MDKIYVPAEGAAPAFKRGSGESSQSGGESPLPPLQNIYTARCAGYDVEELTELFGGWFSALDIYKEIRPGMTVVIKPNLIMKSRPEEAIITHPAVVAAAGRCVKKTGAAVLIAESPGGRYTPAVMRQVYSACGYTEIAETYGFDLYTACESRDVFLPGAVQCKSITMIEPFIGADYIVNIAKLKTHGMMGMSGAVKNLFGAVPGLLKPELHCRFPNQETFADMLVDLCDFLKPNLNIIDGIYAMQGNGPTGGEKRFAGVVIASKSPYAADAAACEVMNIPQDDIFMMKQAKKRGLFRDNPVQFEVIGEPLGNLKIQDFKRARSSSVDFIDRVPVFARPALSRLVRSKPKIRREDCVGCGACAENCPQKIITVENRKAAIQSYKNCIRCFCCHEMCPVHAIDIKRLGVFKL